MTTMTGNLNFQLMGKAGIRGIFLFFAAFFLFFASPAHAEKRLITLTVTDSEIDFNGQKYMLYKFNDSFPGPEIRVNEGDLVRVRLVNTSSGNHGMFFHGLFVNPTVSQEEQEIVVKPGFEYTYTEFVAKPTGTHMYHCSYNMGQHVVRGMYGSFIVEDGPSKLKGKKKELLKYDKDYSYIMADWNSQADVVKETHGDAHPHAMLDNDINTINEKIIDGKDTIVINAKQGERIRLRFGNLGMLPHRIRLPEGFLVTHEDGYLLPDLLKYNTVTVYAGKSNDVIFKAGKPGKMTLYHQINLPDATLANLRGQTPKWQIEAEHGEHLLPGEAAPEHGGHTHDTKDVDEKIATLQKEFPVIVVNITGKDGK
jgi:FtsP/CotA-like multicopper oxidase with cupredoxin domain